MPRLSDSEVDELLRDYAQGRIGRDTLVKTVRGGPAEHSSLPELLARVFPDAVLRWRVARVPVGSLVATEVQLEKPKYRLVQALFPDASTFEKLDRELFPGFPLTGVALGDGRVALIDGHHRVRRFCELASPEQTLELHLIVTRSAEVLHSYLQQVETVENVNGSAAITALPIR